MATKSKAITAEKTVEEIKAEEAPVTAEEPVAEEPKAADPWSEMLDVVVPRKPKGEDQQWYVCVNDRRYLVPANGKQQQLPKPVAQVLLDAIQAEYAAEDFADHIPNKSGENPQQHAI